MNWKAELLAAREKWYLSHYTAAHDFGVPLAKPYSDTTSNGITKAVYDWLKYHGHYVNRINTQGQPRVEKVQLAFGNVRERVLWTHGTTNKGTADIDAIINGKPVKIEVKCKATGDRVSKDQLKERARIEKAQGIYFVAVDMQSFVEWYGQTFGFS